jgi:hypothetical protein
MSFSTTTIIPPRILLGKTTTTYNNNDAFTLTHVVLPQPLVRGSCSISLSRTSYIGFVSKFDQTCSSSSPIMEEQDDDQKKLNLFSKSEQEKDDYSKELDVAVRAVQMACSLCQRVQDTLISKTNHQVQSKDDNSPVTVAGQSFSSSGSFHNCFCYVFSLLISIKIKIKITSFSNLAHGFYMVMCIEIGDYIVLHQNWRNISGYDSFLLIWNATL